MSGIKTEARAVSRRVAVLSTVDFCCSHDFGCVCMYVCMCGRACVRALNDYWISSELYVYWNIQLVPRGKHIPSWL